MRDRLDKRDITNLITAYRQGGTATSLSAAHGLSLTSVGRCYISPVPAGPTYSPSYDGTADRDASLTAHARCSLARTAA